MARTRGPTIRGQLTGIVLIPSISFLVLWTTMAAAGTWQAARVLPDLADGRASIAAVERLTAELRAERRLGLRHLGDPGDGRLHADLVEQYGRTDTALDRAADRATVPGPGAGTDADRGHDALTEGAERLADLRADVDSAGIDRDTALTRYSTLVEDTEAHTWALLGSLQTEGVVAEVAAARELMAAREEFSRSDALLGGAIAAGAMPYEETAQFTFLTASYRDTLEKVEPALADTARDRFAAMAAAPEWIAAEDLSRAVVTRPPVRPAPAPGAPAAFNDRIGVTAADWADAAEGAMPALDTTVAAQQGAVIDGARTTAVRAVAIGVTGLAVTLAAGTTAIVVAMRSSRRLIGRLQRLRSEALALADARLPAIVARTQSGQRVDVAGELPRLSYGDDEIGQVASAFNAAQRTAIGAAVKQAEIREGANRVFLGIAYRNQTLVQRQLRILDEIEDDEDDPRTLRKLFRLDHLATRARRYADNLLILSGAHSARRWRRALPLVDVLRAAISETEDYERVRLTSAPPVRVRGTGVADVVHLIAELVENATQFSPADTLVDVGCASAAGGVAVQVEDRGLGMTPDGYASAARILSGTPEFDVMALQEEPRLGLFVVARLAARHGVEVRLGPSPYGGTRAVAIVPDALLENGGPDDDPGPGAAPLRVDGRRVLGGAHR
jgi:hypothetical protein